MRINSFSIFLKRNVMANSKFEYVRKFEMEDKCLLNCWIVVRTDGRCFHKFSEDHDFRKPVDEAALMLMNRAACQTMHQFQDIVFAYGQSDEYSFVFRKSTNIFQRRASKIISNLVSLFSSSYVYLFNELLPNTKLKYPPSFDARVILYPSDKNLRDYLSWRQVDCHINNLHNTCYWSLINCGTSPVDAQQQLGKMLAADKNELLFSKFKINYNNLPELLRKGTFIYRKQFKKSEEKQIDEFIEGDDGGINKGLIIENIDIIPDKFWNDNSYLLTL